MPQSPIRKFMVAAPLSIGWDQSIDDAKMRMHEHHIRHLPVLRGGELVGILSDRDIALLESLPSIDLKQTRVEEAMIPDPIVFSPETPLKTVVDTMAQRKIGAVPIVEDETIVGIFTSIDALTLFSEHLANG